VVLYAKRQVRGYDIFVMNSISGCLYSNGVIESSY